MNVRSRVLLTAVARLVTIIVTVAGGSVAGVVGGFTPAARAATGGELVRVVDDTGSIAVSVPVGWAIETAPIVAADVTVPHIVARPDADDFLTSITLTAHVYTPDLETAVCSPWWRQGDCTPYDDGALTGYRTYSEECCGSSSRWLTLTGNPASGERVTAEFVVSYDESRPVDAALFDQLATTVEVLASPYPPEWEFSSTAIAPPSDAAGPSLWPYADFYSVPSLGTEPVLGSGCGADGTIGETIPDGLWAGALTYAADEDRWDVNLMCVYSGAAADEQLAAGGATVVAGDRDYLVVDNNPRVRSVPNNADWVTSTFADERTNDTCQLAGSQGMPFDNSQIPGSQAWIRIYEGAVTWVVFGCDAGFMSPGG